MDEPDLAESEAIRQSFENAVKDDTDLTIKLDRFTWRVHSDVFARKSGFFRKICNGNNWKESNERMVTLHDDNPIMFARLLQFLYNGEYCYQNTETFRSDRLTRRPTHITPIQDLLASKIHHLACDEIDNANLDDSSLFYSEIDLGVYDLADKYDIPSLTKFSLERCTTNFPGVSYFSQLFIQHYPDRLKQDPELNEMVVNWIASRFDLLRAHHHEWMDGAGKWLREDFELCTMVMDELRRFATCCICSPF